jgi:integrase
MAAYDAAMKGDSAKPLVIGASRTKPGTVNDVIVRYLRSGAFANLPAASQRERRATLERFRRGHGDKRINMLRPEHVTAIISKLRPFAQRNMLRVLRPFMAFAKMENLIEADPTAGYKPAKRKDTGGFKTWPIEFIAKYRERHPIGTKARLALELLLNVGPRRGDATRLGRQHVRNGEFAFRANKNGVVVDGVPILPELKAAFAAMPKNEHLSFLVTEYGKSFTPAGFGGWFRERCDEAGIPKGYAAHGLRKSSATRLAEEGATAHQLKAWFGWKTLREAERYTEAAERKKLVRSAAALISGTQTGKP